MTSEDFTEVLVTIPPEQISAPVEALLLMANEPLSAEELAISLQTPVDTVTQCLQGLQEFYRQTKRGFELRRVGKGWRLATVAQYADLVSAAVLQGQHAKLSQAALETLAVVAYLQPIARGRVSAIRGVNVDGVMRTLMNRDLIEEAGADPVTGAILFRTTDYFLERMGLTDLAELPELSPLLPEATALEAELSKLAEETNSEN